MSINLCRAIGEIRIRAFSGISALNLCVQDVAGFSKPSGQVWYSYNFIPTDSGSALGDSGRKWFKGIYQVTVFAPSGKGLAALTIAADAIAEHFDRKRLVQGAVTLDTGVPTPGPVNTETDWVSMPLSIAFETR